MPKILLVEDNELNRDMLGRRLKRRGYDVVFAVDGNEGVTKAIIGMPDLILMDMSLPGMNGWEATKTLKKQEKTASIPIIALTAHAMVGDREEALAAGCDDYDTKPVDLKRLLQKMEALLSAVPASSAQSQQLKTAAPAAKIAITPSVEQLASTATRSSQLDSHRSDIPIESLERTPNPGEPPTSSPMPSSASSVKLLVVDDVEANRDMLSRRLLRKGYDVALAESGEAALEFLATNEISLVLLDIMMPGIGGIETLKRIRQTYSQEQLPVIMATAKDRSEDVVNALELGANDYITKPIDLPVALARIQSHLKTREASVVAQQQLLETTVVAAPKPTFWDEHFKLVKVISKHGFGQTAIAQDRQDPEMPLRIIHTFRLDTNNPEILQFLQELFLAELATLKQLNPHPQFLPLVSFLQDGEVFHMVHEYIEGTVLGTVLAEALPLSSRMACKFAEELLTIIDILHQAHLVHRHPHSYCFLCPQEKNQKLILIDYGVIPRILSKLSLQYPQYQQIFQEQGDAIAPEISEDSCHPETDQYAIGHMFLQALQSPGPDQPMGEETAQIFAKMCQSQPQSRYDSIYDANRAVRNQWHKLWKAELSQKLQQPH